MNSLELCRIQFLNLLHNLSSFETVNLSIYQLLKLKYETQQLYHCLTVDKPFAQMLTNTLKKKRTRVGLLILISCVIEPPLNGGNKLLEGESSCSWNVYNIDTSKQTLVDHTHTAHTAATVMGQSSTTDHEFSQSMLWAKLRGYSIYAVSYTHLTLPTILRV